MASDCILMVYRAANDGRKRADFIKRGLMAPYLDRHRRLSSIFEAH